MPVFHRTVSDDGEELARAIPGATIHCVADEGPAFNGRYWHLDLDGLVLARLEMDQATLVALDERVRDFNVWHVISPACAVNGQAVADDEIVPVRPGEGGTMRSAGRARIMTFALQPSLFAAAAELDLPFRAAVAPGRWRVALHGARQRFVALGRALVDRLDAEPRLLATAATRVSLRNAQLEVIAALGDDGAFRPDRAAVGRHSRIMMRFERAIEEAGEGPLDMVTLCRRSGTSRRSLEAVVRQRTGRSPWAYLRWRRLWRARAMLRRPEAGATVTDVAFGLGFWHLSRFAAAYGETFGEVPSATLARAGGNPAAPDLRNSDSHPGRRGLAMGGPPPAGVVPRGRT